MLKKLRKEWHEFKALPVGERFRSVHEQQSGAPIWVKVVVIGAAVVAFGVGIVLTIFPGPAFVFYGIAGALVATESAWVARKLDECEVAVRKLMAKFRRRRSRLRRSRPAEQ